MKGKGKRIFLNGALALSTILFSLVLIEITLYFLSEKGVLRIDRPAYSMNSVVKRFWVDINPDFGVWHENYSRYHLQKSCIDVEYQANSYGAKDVEREKTSTKPRIVVLGDSFVEGYGVSDEKRFTNLLEKETGLEHLNFGTSGSFGPTQYYLLYKSLAKGFSHDAVMVGILPFNDFFDDDYEFGKKAYPGRYRPYWVGDYPNYRLIYFRDTLEEPVTGVRKRVKDFLRGYSYTYNALLRGIEVLRLRRASPDEKIYSGYYDFKQDQWDRLRYALEKIREESKGKKMFVFTMPVSGDLIRYRAKGKTIPPLSEALDRWSKEHGVSYLDLLPEMDKRAADWKDYFLPCDGHWNELGNRVAADILKNSDFYAKRASSYSIKE
jgi:hypothetical protein